MLFTVVRYPNLLYQDITLLKLGYVNHSQHGTKIMYTIRTLAPRNCLFYIILTVPEVQEYIKKKATIGTIVTKN